MICVAVDIGNTSTTVALVRDGHVGRLHRVSSRRFDPAAAHLAVRRAVARQAPDGAILASVVPALNARWRRVLATELGVPPLLLSHRLELGVRVSYPRPATIGADRLANAAGALSRYGCPVVVADFGTALTFDVVSPEGAYIGGIIAPGLPLMTDYLAERTALLPAIKLSGSVGVVGRSTAGAMRIGARVGYRGMVREIVAHLQEGLAWKTVHLSATGGYARWALGAAGLPFTFDPDLTLFGLSRIFALNSGGAG